MERKHITTKKGIKCSFALIAAVLICSLGAKGQVADGLYYIGGPGFVTTNTSANFYLCPTENWYYFQSTTPYYTNTDNGMPFMTTYQCRNGVYSAENAVWIVEKHPTLDYYYIKRAIDGKYLTYNVAPFSNVGRVRVHLEESPSNENYSLFAIVYVPNKDSYDIKSKAAIDNNETRIYLNVNKGNKPTLVGDGDVFNNVNTGGIIGLWSSGSSGDDNSKWYLEPAAVASPTITNNFDGTITITAETGATIYYTTDGTTPTTSSLYGVTTLTFNLTDDVEVVKAIAKGDSDYFPSLVSTYYLPVCYHGQQLHRHHHLSYGRNFDLLHHQWRACYAFINFV